jgi:WW domain-binding protein 4
MRHIGNKERALRDIYKSGERKKKDKEIEAKEMARIDKVRRHFHFLHP